MDSRKNCLHDKTLWIQKLSDSSRSIVPERAERCLSSLLVILCNINAKKLQICKIRKPALVGVISITKKCGKSQVLR